MQDLCHRFTAAFCEPNGAHGAPHHLLHVLQLLQLDIPGITRAAGGTQVDIVRTDREVSGQSEKKGAVARPRGDAPDRAWGERTVAQKKPSLFSL